LIDSMLSLAPQGGTTSVPSMALPSDVEAFKNMMSPGNQVEGAVQTFIDKAENRLDRGDLAVSLQLKEFNFKNDINSLVNAMHESSMNSVSIQLTGKVGTKVSESFESLIKQQ